MEYRGNDGYSRHTHRSPEFLNPPPKIEFHSYL
jgi:hypothetical protein